MCIPFATYRPVHPVPTLSLALLAVLAIMTGSGIGRAQSTNASLSGVVKDPSGGIVPKAELVLTSKQTNTEKRLTTGKDGLYRFANLQAGNYSIAVSAKGFRQLVQEGIVLALNDTATLDVTLSVGSATQTVEVNAAASPINHEDAEHKGEISPDVLKDLPLNVSGSSRSAASFVVVLPGVNTGAGNNPFETRINGGMKMGDEAALD